MAKVVNEFVVAHGQKTLEFNILMKRYLQSMPKLQNSLSKKGLLKFSQADDYFMKYSKRYGFDWLMVAALAYQESRIDQSARSPAGAVGVMQILPSTAGDPNVNIANIEDLENNIHAGIKYLRFLRDRYFENEAMDEANKTFFTFASYNAGPGRVTKLRKEAQAIGLNPNQWFDNVEVVAARRIGRETVAYVSNIYMYYTAYRLIYSKWELKVEASKKVGQ